MRGRPRCWPHGTPSERFDHPAKPVPPTGKRESLAKQARALDLDAEARAGGTGIVSTQALAEYYAAATRKLHVPPDVARPKLELFGHLQVVLIEVDDLLAAAEISRLHQLHFRDALIVRAAVEANCRTLLSEDLQHDRRIDGVRIVNPFLDLRRTSRRRSPRA